jgi:GDPmannose 4,6-dehydratase
LRPANYLSCRVAKSVATIKKGEQKKLRLGDLQAQRDWSDARDIVQGFHLTLQASQGDDFIFASGTSRTVREFVETAFSAAGLRADDHIETDPSVAPTEVTVGLCGNPSKAEKILGWKRQWTFAATITDMVKAEMENRPVIDRANPTPTL